jgi:hypothetical protein
MILLAAAHHLAKNFLTRFFFKKEKFVTRISHS